MDEYIEVAKRVQIIERCKPAPVTHRSHLCCGVWTVDSTTVSV